MNVTFDTLAVVRDMENAGLKREATEAVATAIRAGQGELATKEDIDALTKDDQSGHGGAESPDTRDSMAGDDVSGLRYCRSYGCVLETVGHERPALPAPYQGDLTLWYRLRLRRGFKR